MAHQDPRPIDPPEDVEKLIEDFAMCEVKYEEAKAAYNEAKAALISAFPGDEIGEFSITTDRWQVELTVPEKVKWDSNELAAYFGSEMPMYVKRNLSITETDYRRLPLEEREAISGAREVVCGTRKLSVEVRK